MKRAPLMIASAALIMASGLASAADQPGSFPGVVIDAKIIGGDQYEPLYTRIGEWEKLTGAKVNILTKKNGFDIDKEFKSDIAANDVKWCVGWNHTSFAPQYTGLYTDLNKLIPKEELDKYVPGIIKASTVDGKLEMLPGRSSTFPPSITSRATTRTRPRRRRSRRNMVTISRPLPPGSR